MDSANPTPNQGPQAARSWEVGERAAPPLVTVIVPARNEEANLERCLRSLVLQKGVSFEVIVVNDSSTDRTRKIAEGFIRAPQCPFLEANDSLVDFRVLDAPEPIPAGWTGKTNALVAAESAAHGEWLLFTDADTEHLPGSLAAAVAEATKTKADLLSYSPEQVLTGIRQRLIMPLIFGELAVRYSPRRINDPGQPDAAANGQYLLARATAHQQVGGFASVANELLEDVALARRYKAQGYRIHFRYGHGAVRTRMYSNWGELREGWTKNLALLFPDARALARKRLGEFVWLFFLLTLATFLTVLVSRHLRFGTFAYWPANLLVMLLWLLALSNFGVFYARVARAHFAYWPSLFSLFGLPGFASLLRRSADAHEQGSVSWRGRAYTTLSQQAESELASKSGSDRPAGKSDGAESPSAASNSK